MTKHNMTIKDIESGSIETLVYELQIDIERIRQHVYNIQHQYQQLKKLKDEISS